MSSSVRQTKNFRMVRHRIDTHWKFSQKHIFDKTPEHVDKTFVKTVLKYRDLSFYKMFRRFNKNMLFRKFPARGNVVTHFP